MKGRVLLGVLCIAGVCPAQQLDRRELRIPMAEAGPQGLEALLVFPRDGGRHPTPHHYRRRPSAANPGGGSAVSATQGQRPGR